MANFEHRHLQIVEAMATIVIEKKMIEAGGGFDRYVRTLLPAQCENAVLSIVELFAADNIENVVVAQPANWWEAFKEATAPQIVLDRWPVKYKRTVVDIKAIWQGYKPPTGSEKYGPFLPYSLTRTLDDTEEDL